MEKQTHKIILPYGEWFVTSKQPQTSQQPTEDYQWFTADVHFVEGNYMHTITVNVLMLANKGLPSDEKCLETAFRVLMMRNSKPKKI